MNNPKFFPEKIYIDRKVLGSPLVDRIIKNAEKIPAEIVNCVPDMLKETCSSKDPVAKGKKNLLLTFQKGEFIKPCPCTPGYIGCNYFIINAELNCPLDCSYCILQHYLTNPFITVSVNREDLWAQADAFLDKHKKRGIRIGTGELGDSLALDHLTENSREMMAYFRTKKNVLFEFKTKTENIEHILSSKPFENIIISWSLNSSAMAETEEKGAPSIDRRIQAARLVAERGFRVGFHFDPIIIHPHWKEGYAAVIEALLASVHPARIAWISLGSLRFSAKLKPIIQKRFPESRIILEEMVRGKDGKFRYFKPLRAELVRTVTDFIRKSGGERIPLYLCMESREIWEKGLQKKPRSKEDVERSISLLLGECR